jgi:hypothetical protein
MKKTILWVIGLLLIQSPVLACPACAGSLSNPRDNVIVYILMAFIGLTYIPFFILYRMVIKHRNVNKIATTQAHES